MPSCIDSHTHLYLRGAEDLQAMARAGVGAAAICAYLPVAPSGPSTLVDLFRWLVEAEPARFAACGLRALPVVGVHPRCIPDGGWLDPALEAVDGLLASGAAVALGEVGLEACSTREKEVLAAQLRLAAGRKAPVVAHTPRADKERALGELLALLEASGVEPARVVVDHLTPPLVGRVRERGLCAGLTVQPGKLSPEDVLAVVEAHGAEGLLVNSDAAHGPADVLAVPRVAGCLASAGVDSGRIAQVTSENAAAFFGLARI